MRPYDFGKFTRAWLALEGGQALKKVPCNTGTATDIRRLQQGGWRLDDVIAILQTGKTGIGAIPTFPPGKNERKEPVEPEVIDRQREAMNLPQTLTEIAIGPAPVMGLREARLREAQEDLQDGTALRGLARAILETAKPMVRTSKKVVKGTCECGREFEQTVLKPMEQDLRAMVALFELSDEKVRRSLALPKGIGKVPIKALTDLEPRWKLEQLRNATAMALRGAVEDGTITQAAGQVIWERIKQFGQQAA